MLFHQWLWADDDFIRASSDTRVHCRSSSLLCIVRQNFELRTYRQQVLASLVLRMKHLCSLQTNLGCRLIRLSLSVVSVSHSVVFFSHNKSVNSTSCHDLSAKWTMKHFTSHQCGSFWLFTRTAPVTHQCGSFWLFTSHERNDATFMSVPKSREMLDKSIVAS